MLIRELSAEETGAARPALCLLRPHLNDVTNEEFMRVVNDVQRPQGYRLVAAFEDGDPAAASAAGFRVLHHLAWGQALYCDDLSTRPEYRNRGHAGALVDWMMAEARRLGCKEFHLDSGVGPDRQAAHRLYFNKGMRITAHHFAVSL